MSHWAELDENNVVIRVLVGSNEEQDEGKAFFESLGGTWVQTSYNGKIRKRFASIGSFYDSKNDCFIDPKPYDSWILNTETMDWEAPIEIPKDGKKYNWDEKLGVWVEAKII